MTGYSSGNEEKVYSPGTNKREFEMLKEIIPDEITFAIGVQEETKNSKGE